MLKISKGLGLVGLLYVASMAPSYALNYVDPDRLYVAIEPFLTSIDIDDETFTPAMVRIKAGGYITKRVGIEFHGGGGINDDSLNNLDVEIDSMYGVYVRYNKALGTTFNLYAVGGYAVTTILTTQNDTIERDEDYESISVGIGAEERLEILPSVSVIAELNQFYRDDDLSIVGISLGLKWGF